MAHPAETGRPGASKHPHEYSFGLIVSRVADGDAVTAMAVRQLVKKPIT
jgi:hypothetical protein